MRKSLLSLLLVLPRLGYAGPVVEAVPVEAAPAISAGAYVDPLLLGSPADPTSPISESLSMHAENLDAFAGVQAMDSRSAGAYLNEAAGRSPLDRVAAGALSMAATDPLSAGRLHALANPGPGTPLSRVLSRFQEGPLAPASYRSSGQDRSLHRLADSAIDDPSVSALFDGRASNPSLGLDDLEIQGGHLYVIGKKVKPLGQGGFGIVYPHPLIEGAVIKLTAMSFDAFVHSGITPKGAYEGDLEATRDLGRVRVGPRLLGTSSISGRAVTVKERVYGPMLQAFIDANKYGAELHALVMDMISRMADKRVRVGDMNPANLMIGRTLVDPKVRSYHVDGGEPENIEPTETTEDIRRSIYNHVALTKVRFHKDIGEVQTDVHFKTIVERALDRSAPKSGWQKFKDSLYDFYFPPK